MNQPNRHLVRCHSFDKSGGKLTLKRSRDGGNSDGNVAVMMIKRQRRSQDETFDREGWRWTQVEWLVSSNQSLRQASGDELRALISFRNPTVEPLVPQSHHTSRDWIVDAFTVAKPMVVKSLQMARSTVTISFDHWLADNELDLLGVVTHYLDSNLELKTVLLKPSYGHDAQELQDTLLFVLREHNISHKIGYFIAHHAANNDGALRLLSHHIDVKPAKQRLRCSGHVISLVVKVILYSVDSECLLEVALSEADHGGDSELYDTSTVSKFEAALRFKDEASRLDAWRRKGPIGKLHNLIMHIKSGSVRRRFFETKQGETDTRLYRVIVDGGVRWNSACEMVGRAFQVRDALQLYQEHFRSSGTDRLNRRDCLSEDDLQELTDLLKLLRPLKDVSLKVQAVAKDGQNGALW
jgi:hypothetical protein